MINIEKLKKQNVTAGRMELVRTNREIVHLSEKYYDEDKKILKIKRRKHGTWLYLSVYNIRFYEFFGVMSAHGDEGAVYENERDLYIINDLEDLFEEREDIIEHFVKNSKPKEYVIHDETDGKFYKISLYFDDNTMEKTDEFVGFLREQGHTVSILKVGVKDNE